MQQYRKDNKEYFQEYTKKYYDANKDKINLLRRERRKQNDSKQNELEILEAEFNKL